MLFLPYTVKVSLESEDSNLRTIAPCIRETVEWERDNCNQCTSREIMRLGHQIYTCTDSFKRAWCLHSYIGIAIIILMQLTASSPVLERIDTIRCYNESGIAPDVFCRKMVLECLSVPHRSKPFVYWRNDNKNIPKLHIIQAISGRRMTTLERKPTGYKWPEVASG